MNSKFHEQCYRKPLVICCAGIGDMLLSTPLIRRVAEISESKVDVLTVYNADQILWNNSYVNAAWILNEDFIEGPGTRYSLDGFFRKRLYSIVFSVRSPLKILRAARLAKVNCCWIGNPRYECLRPSSRLLGLLSGRFRKRYYGRLHMVKTLLGMIPSQGGKIDGSTSPFMFSAEDIPILRDFALLGHNRFVVLHPGGKDPIKKLKFQVISKVIRSIGEERVVLVGGECDREIAETLKKEHQGVHDMIGKFSLNEVYGVIEKCALCIAPDSIVMHMAAAAGAPLIALAGNALPETFGPFPPRDNAIVLSRNPSCAPCNRRVCTRYEGHSCVQDISADEILAASAGFLEIG